MIEKPGAGLTIGFIWHALPEKAEKVRAFEDEVLALLPAHGALVTNRVVTVVRDQQECLLLFESSLIVGSSYPQRLLIDSILSKQIVRVQIIRTRPSVDPLR